MDSEAYWEQRAEEREKYWHKKCQETIEKELAGYYRASLGHLQTEIAALYGRFAVDNELTMAEARRLLQGNEFRQWRMDIQDYVKQIKATGDKGLERELNVLAMRSRISRFDKLYGETLVELDRLGRNVSKGMKSFLTDAYKDNYYHGLYDIAKTGELKNAVSKVDSMALEDVLRTRWSGKNYSERIWKNQKLLAQTIKDEMMVAVHRGESVDKISKRIAKRMDVGISNARRLVRTEMNFINNRASLDSIEDAGMKYYRFIATLDRRTSAACRSHDGQVYAVTDASPGSNMPPLHPHCRSTIAGSLYGPEREKTGTRAARDEGGKTIYVPANMKYEDWKSVYVDKSKTLEEVAGGYKTKPQGWRRQFMRQVKPTQEMNFKPAKSIDEAVNYIKKFVYSDEFSLKGKFDLSVINGLNEAVYNVYKKYRNKLKITSIERLPKNDMKYRQAAYNPVSGKLTIKNSSLAKMKATAEKNFESGFSASRDLYANYYHEIGHAVWEDLPQVAKEKIAEIYAKEKHEAYLQWMDLGGYSSGIKQADIFGKKLSRYAHTSKEEFFSEAFSQIMDGHMRPVSRKVSDILDSYYAKSLMNSAQNVTINNRMAAGALNPDSKEAFEHAKTFYSEIRKRNTDYKVIAARTGFPEDYIKKVKEHLFLTKHDLGANERQYFYPDYEIAQSWQRLTDKNMEIQEHDLILLQHEYLEAEYMRKGLSQAEAHAKAEEKFNYAKALKERK